MASIVEFLEARIAEDEAEARRDLEGLAMTEAKADLRVFAECEAKRKIIALADDVEQMDAQLSAESGGEDLGTADAILKALAAVYASHPDYQQEWTRG
ncbi:hypothetical protein QFZ23_003010 [Arthrobacter globiformis]|uniref:DUF6221 family protein n=1 Tax=Arthrobacter globiformis TaxID=1665 RepID=UPI002785A395|nr:DUF6221 family protein [Arthrobacter globiformis]MDQ1059109.1 hypothetical protein [Arthrobacter globiformis]